MAQKTISIIGGGPSIKKMEIRKVPERTFTIGVNESSILLPTDIAISMDRLWMEGRWEKLKAESRKTYFRVCAWKLRHQWSTLQTFEGDIRDPIMTKEEGKLVGNNSGACALNLAYQMKPEILFLFGYDMRIDTVKEHYWYKDYEWSKPNRSGSKYNYWLERFPIIAKQFEDDGIKVYNVNPDSAIKEFEKITFHQFLEMTDDKT